MTENKKIIVKMFLNITNKGNRIEMKFCLLYLLAIRGPQMHYQSNIICCFQHLCIFYHMEYQTVFIQAIFFSESVFQSNINQYNDKSPERHLTVFAFYFITNHFLVAHTHTPIFWWHFIMQNLSLSWTKQWKQNK